MKEFFTNANADVNTEKLVFTTISQQTTHKEAEIKALTR
jgi:hypothetical protein